MPDLSTLPIFPIISNAWTICCVQQNNGRKKNKRSCYCSEVFYLFCWYSVILLIVCRGWVFGERGRFKPWTHQASVSAGASPNAGLWWHPAGVCKISLSFRFRISLSDMTNYKSAFGKVCRIKNRQTFRSMPILNSAYHAVKYAELRIGILLKICRFVIRHITTWYGMPN